MEKEVVITYETLFEILRREKSREELQELPENFNEEVKKYLREKKQTMISTPEDPFSEIEREKTQRQILNIKKILNELYERREKKIMAMALSKSRTPKSVIETSTLLANERVLYEKLLSILNEARQEALRGIIIDESAERKVEEKPPETQEQQEEVNTESPAPTKENGLQKIRFLCDVSQFVGPNLEIYGPFKADETANLPASVCKVLISKNKAELAEKEGEEQTF